MQPSETKR